MLGSPVEVIAKVFTTLTAFKVRCQQHLMVRLPVQLVKRRGVATHIQEAARLIDNA